MLQDSKDSRKAFAGWGTIFPAKSCWDAWRSGSLLVGGLVKIADEAKLCKPICLTFEVKQKVGCTTYGWALLWRRIGPFLLTNFGCRHCSFQYVLSICGAYFSDVMVSPGFRSCSGSDKQQTTKQWKSDCDLFFFGARLALGSVLELLLHPMTELVIIGCHIISTFRHMS